MVCNSCNGCKKVAPLGGIEITCSNCNGLGHVLPPVMKAELKPITMDTNVKRMGRPKKL